ncbi:relaxase/mobilization nuclease domain-containing protein [Acinetobacter sp. ME22]|uniref:relaxase/mobilization nuclease domain-containing protein n=1 Tax=Acinetobacter sp. ME22 TaxID=2904802 RepID=UPI001EDB1335|nr:relaxase/mobilization nuclease domain-containing protein [Acinetobacter sp. ME22]MCG2574934.1 relaxase/mobilization nuclease domain-containing protein [Acinetobacter sp. ME22]
MILKLIANTRSTSLKQRVNGLLNYIQNPENTRAQNLSNYIRQPFVSQPAWNEDALLEKCVYANSRNFLDDDSEQQKIEMLQTASLNRRVEDPIVHLVASFKKFEVPSIEQIEQQIDILLRHLNAEALQVQYAMHLDTDNAHYHVVINKIHPIEKNQHQQHKCVNLGDGWILNALHRSAAEIEATQGWRSEPNPMFVYHQQSKTVVRNPDYQSVPAAEKLPTQILDQASRHQQPSALQQKIDFAKSYQLYVETAVQNILRRVNSWPEWHQALAEKGLTFEKKRNGAVFQLKTFSEQITFKASLFCQKQATLPQLQHHWGPYQAAAEGIRLQAVPDQEVQSRGVSQSSKTKIHPFHLFKAEDYLVAELHTIYLALKTQKDQITVQHQQASAKIKLDHESYQNVERDLQIQQQQQKYPSIALARIQTALDDQHAERQQHDRAHRRSQYALSHRQLTAKLVKDELFKDELGQRFLSSSKINSAQITSYTDFISHLNREHPLVIVQQFLLDQRQSGNFIHAPNPQCRQAQLIYDKQLKHEPIAVMNQHGIQMFSQYSIPRIQQCLQLIDAHIPIEFSGEPSFQQQAKIALLHLNHRIEDPNPRHELPRLEQIASADLEVFFDQLYQHFQQHHNLQTSIFKANLLLSCCQVNTDRLERNLKEYSDEFFNFNLPAPDRNNLMLRLKSVLCTQPIAQNRQYFNAQDLDCVWQIALKLEYNLLKRKTAKIINKPQPQGGSKLVIEEIVLPERDPDFLNEVMQELQFEQRKSRLQQQFLEVSEINLTSNSLSACQRIETEVKPLVHFPADRYQIICQFEHQFYIDRELNQTAFIENTYQAYITVVSPLEVHVRDALFLAHARYGEVMISGNEEFKAQVEAIAQQYQIPVIRKELLEQRQTQTEIPSHERQTNRPQPDLTPPVEPQQRNESKPQKSGYGHDFGF